MMRRIQTCGLVALGLLVCAMPVRADDDGVSFNGNILWNNNSGGDQYDQTVYGALNQTTETFVTSNFSNNDIVDPLLDPDYDNGVSGPWRPQPGSDALLANSPNVVNVSDVDAFFADVPFRGALGSSAQADWTRGWIYTNLQGGAGRTDIDTGKPVVTVSTNITIDTTWSSTNNYALSGRVAVEPGVTLTIEPGTAIFGAVVGSYLVVERDGNIEALGSAVAPIIFTSAANPGSQAPGDWAGIVIHGKAVANCATGGVVAGCNLTTTGNDCESEGGAGFFGGSDDSDDSGTLRYVRSEYAGQEISLNNELNAFTFNAVGSGTTLEYLQAHRGTDDLFEWFGGNSRSRYFVGTGGDDDGFDWQMGFRGLHQFGVIVATALDNADADKGMECDNNEFDYSCPGESNGVFANLTLIGEPTKTANGIHFRRGTNGGIFNSIIVDWNSTGFRMQHDETFDNGVGPQPTLLTPVTAVDDRVTLPGFRVSFAPNPVISNSTFSFTLTRPEQVEIRVFNVRGRLVERVVDRQLGAGPHTISWNPREQSNGIYLYQVRAGEKVATGKMMVVN